jgi:hypothetical protein
VFSVRYELHVYLKLRINSVFKVLVNFRWLMPEFRFSKVVVTLVPEYLSLYSDELWVGRPEFDSRQGQVIFVFSVGSSPALGPTQRSIQ